MESLFFYALARVATLAFCFLVELLNPGRLIVLITGTSWRLVPRLPVCHRLERLPVLPDCLSFQPLPSAGQYAVL
jgi:hypothetical protein